MTMNRRIVLLTILFTLLFLFRVQQIGGISEPESGEFEAITIRFEPILNTLASQAQILLPQPQSGLLMGMVLGVKNSLPFEFSNALRRTSTIHMVVVSGQNLTLLSGFILSFAALFGRRKTILLNLGVIVFYAFLTGFQIPVIRAAIMVILASTAQLFDREADSWWILGLTGALMLIYNPNWLLSISFQLSFLATIGVVIVAPEIINRLNFLPNLVKQDLGISFAAQALTWPIIAMYFNQASLVGIFANAFVLWTVPAVMISGAFALLVSLISIPLGALFALIPGVLLTYFSYVVTFFNRFFISSIYIDNVSIFVWLGYYILLLGIYLYLRKANLAKLDEVQASVKITK
jgi:competence protein ComEC